MNKAILTLPMMPVDGTNYGKYVTPIVCETLRNIYNGEYYQCINLLDSFNDRTRDLDKYIKSLDDNNIKYNNLWYDKENIDVFLNNINQLIKKGYIHEYETELYSCPCGIIEVEENKIASCNPNNLKFEFKDDMMHCRICGGVCEKHKEKVLIFSPHGIKREQLQFLPVYLNKDAKTYDNIVMNSYTTISRKRDTGISIKFNGINYNIDIDFLWATYLSTFEEKQKIVVTGNRMLYQLFLVGVIEKCLKPNNNTILLGTPYITNIRQITDDCNFMNNEKLRKLSILFNIKWSKKEKNYDTTILKYLNNVSEEKMGQLYDIINRPSTNSLSFYEDVNNVLKKQFNMQEGIKTLKKERR